MARRTFNPSGAGSRCCPSILARCLLPLVMGGIATLAGCGDSTFKKQVIRGCEAEGVPTAACECVADKLEEKYTEAELKAMHDNEDRAKLGRYFDDMISAIRVCSR